ncbi:SPARC-like protein 1 [Clupea harengus]|uniref:SPARC-like protein 1 n=1 Tax=Clupea harengus TaxID=7950 RepID=A0A6P3W8K5_CLUHA|nr:SPARC-like protein 1 [Clupea harengus]
MKTHLLLLYLMASAIVMCVRSKPHAKHRGISKHSQTPQEKDSDPEEPNEGKGSILPTFLPFEASSQEQEDEEVNNEGVQASEVVGFGEEEEEEEEENKESGTPVLLSEEALARLLQGSEEEEEEQEGQETQEGEAAVKESDEGEGESEGEVNKKEGEEENGEKEEEEAEGQEGVVEKRVEEEEEEEDESESSTESENRVDLDYASDSDGSEPLETKLEEATPLTSGSDSDQNQPEKEKEEKVEDQEQDGEEIPAVMADYDPETAGEDAEMPPKKEKEEVLKDKTQEKDVSPDKEEMIDNEQGDSDGSELLQEAKNSMEFRAARLPGGEGDKQEQHTNDSGSHTKGKGRKHKKNQRKRKGQMQGDQPIPAEPANPGHRQMLGQEKTPDTTDNTVQRPKRRKSGKWAPMIGMNPVQIRATVELYPSLRPPPTLPGQGVETNPCENVRCKRGKVCKVNEDDKPVCVCQEAADCPTSVTEFDHVCGTDNKTYDTSCQLFATKCNLEGTKKGHRLHLDFTGACKFIPPCLGTELAQFPLRMRDWLKNVLLQLFEHDTMSPGFLTPKQRARVQKLYESERRLHAGDHPIELLAQDFEKNYHMYIYPVHWQFAQMDQHPTDRYLSHSELAPLRVPLVPMEHCTSDFFQQCDADKDKQVSFKEWGHCFGIRDEDMDTHLLF